MARVLVLTDRLPEDRDWKGAFAWNLIQSLAESQHQVLVLTTRDLHGLTVAHPRLTVARPGPSWRVDQFPKFVKAWMSFRPEVVHTFAPQASALWSGLSLWPLLDKLALLPPQPRRYVTIFEARDVQDAPSCLSWLRGTHGTVAFTTKQVRELEERWQLHAEIAPLDWPAVQAIPSDMGALADGVVLVPAPVSEWRDTDSTLFRLLGLLEKEPALRVEVLGGWGDLPASRRRAGWTILEAVKERVHHIEDLDANGFQKRLADARAVWLDGLNVSSWRYVFAHHVARRLGKEILGPSVEMVSGSSANFLSRLYAYS